MNEPASGSGEEEELVLAGQLPGASAGLEWGVVKAGEASWELEADEGSAWEQGAGSREALEGEGEKMAEIEQPGEGGRSAEVESPERWRSAEVEEP